MSSISVIFGNFNEFVNSSKILNYYNFTTIFKFMDLGRDTCNHVVLAFILESLWLTRCTPQQCRWQKNIMGLHCRVSHSWATSNGLHVALAGPSHLLHQVYGTNNPISITYQTQVIYKALKSHFYPQ